MEYTLQEKIVLITGGAAGIGFSCAKHLLKNGVQGITIVDMDNATGEAAVNSLNKEFGPNKAIFVEANVTKSDQLEAAFKKTVSTWKSIDVVINNAGIMNDENWELAISVNCNGVVRGTLLGLKYMRKDSGGNGGAIVNICSIAGLETYPSCPIYVGTKHFVLGFNRSLGNPYHYNQTGVRILTMCPGVTDTNMPATGSNYGLKALSPDIGKQFQVDFSESKCPMQPAESVGRAMVTIINKGASGSVWVSEENELYEVEIPDRKTYRKS